MRRLIRKGRAACYHCVARIVGGQFLLDDVGKEKLVQMMWRQAAFSGIEIVTYCMMSNHFHVLIRVPAEQPELSDALLLQRVEALYGKGSGEAGFLREAIAQRGGIYESARGRLAARMGNVSVFMKELKQRFSRWYNRGHERFGTLWAERFRSVLVEDGGLAMEAVAAYIDLNPIRAGLVEDPKDYRFCGYAAALAGHALARAGLMSLGEKRAWNWPVRQVPRRGRGWVQGSGGAFRPAWRVARPVPGAADRGRGTQAWIREQEGGTGCVAPPFALAV